MPCGGCHVAPVPTQGIDARRLRGIVKIAVKNAHPKENKAVKSYVFSVIVERDEDVWRAYVPELEAKAAATWGSTRDEALKNIREVAQMVIEELLEDGVPLPAAITVSDQPVVAVTV